MPGRRAISNFVPGSYSPETYVMSKAKIGVILSTTRAGRFADKAVAWLLEHAAERNDLAFEIVDLRDYPLPLYDEPISPLWQPARNEVAQRFARKIESFDGYIFVTAEYNHGVPGALKNAIDYTAHVFARKPAAYVGYGGVGAARAIEQLRQINIEQQIAPLKSAVHIGGADFVDVLLNGKSLADKPHLAPSVNAMVDELAWWAYALKQARGSEAPALRVASGA
jgi:NAD(P)H-dependent FMN reductase